MSKIWCEMKKERRGKKICSSQCYKNTKPIHVCCQPQPWNRQKNEQLKSHSTWYGGLAVRENIKNTHTHTYTLRSELTGCYAAAIAKYLILILAIFICKTMENQIKLFGQLHKHPVWFVIQSWFRTFKRRKNKPATPKWLYRAKKWA